MEVGDEHGQPALVQIVAPVHAHRALRLAIAAERDARKHAHFFEGSVVLVVIQIVRAGVIGDVQIGPAVVVVVAPDHPQSVIVVDIVHSGFL